MLRILQLTDTADLSDQSNCLLFYMSGVRARDFVAAFHIG